ncbi:MAG TPA: hypothetical protein VM266_01030 [Solirubrobacteraceae bacterium]|nr:hypothetical protein [Solirubrobacteraceae bacterium]
MTSIPQRAALLTAAALATGVALGGPAEAADPMPTFSGCGKFAKDSATDASDPIADPAPRQVEIENAWVDTTATGATFNMTVADLTGTVPPPATSITYAGVYGGAGDATNFVRAHVDFSGTVVFEYGHQEPLGPSTRYAYDGPSEGKLFPGEHGVVQVKIPAEAGGKPGITLRGITGTTQLGRTTVVPGAINQSPSRGLSFETDTVGVGNATIAACDGAGGDTPPAATPPGETPPGGQPPSSSSEPLPVRLVTKSLKRAKARKTVKVKVRTSEPLTDLAVRLAKGRTAYGTGKLRKLTKTGTFKLKLRKAIKKGTYVLDVAGTDGQNQRRLASLKLKVR